jgi:hypothetical protein
MTEQFIRDVAERFGLEVLKRITTGNDKSHFATFELTGLRVRDAWPVIKDASERGIAFDYIRTSDAEDTLYIGCESVWCEV